MSVIVQCDAVHKKYPTPGEDLVVLRDVNLVLERGQSAAILGPSGCGKSTLLNILGTLDTPSSGSVVVDGAKLSDLPENELARFRCERIGFVFQEHHLLRQCNVLENVLLPTIPAGRDPRAAERARGLLDRVGLASRLQHRPAELSGGERQRVALARAIINEPALILADEPTGNLDRASAEAVADLLCDLQRDENATLMVVTHSDTLAGRFDRQLVLADGQLVDRKGA